jgi:hypothetical protein
MLLLNRINEEEIMAKFILLYKGPATPNDKMTQEQRDKIRAAWNEWMGKVGKAVVEVGSPMNYGKSVVDDGTVGKAIDINGYSIIEAKDLDAAVSLVDGHPFLSDKTGKFSVEVYELVDIQM